MAKKPAQDTPTSTPVSPEEFPEMETLSDAQMQVGEQTFGSNSSADVESGAPSVSTPTPSTPVLIEPPATDLDAGWREIAQEWRFIADYWKNSAVAYVGSAAPGKASVSAAPLVGGDGSADEICFLIVADTTPPSPGIQGGPLQAVRNISLMTQVASLAKQPVVNVLQGANCNDATFISALTALASRASQAKANNRNMKVVIHLSCHGSDTSLMVSSAQKQIVRARSQYEALARQIWQNGATGVLFLCDCCAVKPVGAAAIPELAGAAFASNKGRTYLNFFTGFVVINGCTPPPAGPGQTGEVCIYASDRGGFFTNGIFNTLTNVNFLTSHNGFINSVAQDVSSLFNTFATNGGIAIDGKTYTRQRPFYRVLES